MSTAKPIRVMIVDDHSMVRRGLAAILGTRPDLQLVGEASNGREALKACVEVRPDVILMDLVMPEMDGTVATRAIRARCPEIQVIALTSFKEKELVEGVVEAGAIGYLLKTVSAEELADAIRSAHAGRPSLTPEVALALIQADKLERLARAIINAPADVTALTGLLEEYVPGMFPNCRVEIRVLPDQMLLRHPIDVPPVPGSVWEWLVRSSGAHHFLPETGLPWGAKTSADEGLVTVPIFSVKGGEPLGGIHIACTQRPGAVAELVPAARSLAAQITSALDSAQSYVLSLEHQHVARELAMAGQIQASFLPRTLPEVEGWQLAATLKPARETAGDFYDFIPLPGGRWGIVIADVADKGMGAALYMALCRTLLRTFATEHLSRPDHVLAAANRRVLSDARANLFVTAFYGVLDPHTGRLVYSNAGHNSPLWFDGRQPGAAQELRPTGMALGVIEDASWELRTVDLASGDLLLLYTDGVTEAQDGQERLFGTGRLLEVALTHAMRSPQSILDAVIAAVQTHADGQPQFDDITMIVARREA
jgi:serine phosphatase RsbU (regulator of sigma subunit)/DNA-binding NarL/FixJ family response regulator